MSEKSIITTNEEADALPNQTIIQLPDGEAFQKNGKRWFAPGMTHAFSRVESLPAVVLWEPRP